MENKNTPTDRDDPSQSNTPALTIELLRDAHYLGSLRFANRTVVRHFRSQSPRIHFSGSRQNDDHEVRQFVTRRYQEAFDASINVGFPEMVWVCDHEHQLIAAVGLRSAHNNELFLEQYTADRIDNILQQPREKIVEIGNLVSRNRSATVALFCAVALVLERRGVSHAVATGTELLEKRFGQLGMRVARLCPARLSQIADRGEHWGQYYNCKPNVLSGSVSACANHLRNRLHTSLRQSARTAEQV